MAVIDALQRFPNGGDQLIGAGLAVVCMCEVLALNPHEVVERSRIALREADQLSDHRFDALRDYTKGEIGGAAHA